MSIEIDLQRIMGQYLCKINKHFLQFPIKSCYYRVDRFTHDKLIYHKNIFDFLPKYHDIHFGNTLLVDDMPYKTYLNPPSNAIFVESYEYMPKEDNYLMKTLLPYLEFLQYSRLSVPTFVEFYSFSTIRSIKDDDGRFWMLFAKCTMVYSTNFCRNCSTSLVSSPNIVLCSFLPILLWIF
jgi:hypothetical protein